MTPQAPDADEQEAQAEHADADGAPGPRQTGWQLILQLMLSPMAFLAPCVSCGAATTFKHSFGSTGAILGALGGFALGTGLVAFWYFVIDDAFGKGREQRFADRMIRDVEAGRFRRRLGRPEAEMGRVEAVPLNPGGINIETGVGTAVARIDAHDGAPEALTAAEVLRDRHPRDPRAIGCLARALLRAGGPKEGARLASDALHAAVLTGRLGEVSSLVTAFWPHRDHLTLDPEVCRAVAQHLDKDGRSDEAAYFHAGRSSLA